MKSSDDSGFTVLEVLIALGLTMGFALLSMNYSSSTQRELSVGRTNASRSRVLSGVRALAGMPAALRNSMRAAAADGTAVNPEFNDCTSGTHASACKSGVAHGLTLYSPLLQPTPPSGFAIQPITAPSGGSDPGTSARFSTFGSPCAPDETNCPIEVRTSFTPQCGPAPFASPVPPDTLLSPTNLLAPASTCTIADLVEVTYWVIRRSVGSGLPEEVLTGSVVTSVSKISGNVPQ